MTSTETIRYVYADPDIAETYSDEQLLAKLNDVGVKIDRLSMEALCNQVYSVQALSEPFEEEFDKQRLDGTRDNPEYDVDWIWVCLNELWKRWFPDELCFERMDDLIDLGSEELSQGNRTQALNLWRQAWVHARGLLSATGASISELDDYSTIHSHFSYWISIFSVELLENGKTNNAANEENIALCDEMLKRADIDDESKSILAGSKVTSHVLLHQWNIADSEFEKLTRDFPGAHFWNMWAMSNIKHNRENAVEHAERILRAGLKVNRGRERSDIADTLISLLNANGRYEEAAEILESTCRSLKGAIDFEKGLLSYAKQESQRTHKELSISLFTTNNDLTRPFVEEVGRKDPCPCGSGKKYKRCCG